MTAADQSLRQLVRMPNCAGMPLAKARVVLELAGFSNVCVLFADSYEPRDSVLEQRPVRGQMAYPDAEVTLTVARRGVMEHLPAIYRRSDAVGRNFVRELCFLLEHMFGSVATLLEKEASYFDPHVCPPEFLDWLAGWTAFVLDTEWTLEKKRTLLRRAVDLYRIRGTPRGLALFLKLFTDVEPEIRENEWPFRGFRIGTARIGIDSVILPPVDLARSFIVQLPIRFEALSTEQLLRIHQIIRTEKPAHTQYYLRFAEDDAEVELREFFTIGVRSGIGIGAEVVGVGVLGSTDVVLDQEKSP